MPSSRRFGSPWLLLLVLVCSLLGRPMHDAWHIAHPFGESERGAALVAAVVADVDADVDADADVVAIGASQGQGDLQDDVDDIDIDNVDDDGGLKSDACAWCLFHAQAAAPGRAPDALLTHAEASAPPVALPRGPLPALDWTVAKPRGPPSA
ncbi:DUF2946 family protein [Roseateles noduli]|uniref:DUF2946 family protein n=1 Tax=Roseateles noduli TaxID=2052484 RepID=UPI003D65725F